MKKNLLVSVLVVFVSLLVSGAEKQSKKSSLEQQLKQWQGKGSCQKDQDCRFIGIGHRACGGPRYYLTYSVADAKEEKLKELADQIAVEERSRQAEGGMMGICVVTPEPIVTCVKNLCTNKAL